MSLKNFSFLNLLYLIFYLTFLNSNYFSSKLFLYACYLVTLLQGSNTLVASLHEYVCERICKHQAQIMEPNYYVSLKQLHTRFFH